MHFKLFQSSFRTATVKIINFKLIQINWPQLFPELNNVGRSMIELLSILKFCTKSPKLKTFFSKIEVGHNLWNSRFHHKRVGMYKDSCCTAKAILWRPVTNSCYDSSKMSNTTWLIYNDSPFSAPATSFRFLDTSSTC